MAWFPLDMQTLAHPGHASECPLCHNTSKQTGWCIGAPGLNLQILRAAYIHRSTLIEATMSHCRDCDFGYFWPAPSANVLQDFYTQGGGRTAKSDAAEQADLNRDNHVQNVAIIDAVLQQLGMDVKKLRNKTVLEIGAGFSSMAKYFTEHGLHYIANDVSDQVLGFLKRTYQAATIDCMLNEIPEEHHSSFDLIFSKDSLEHHATPRSSLQKMFALLAPGGHIALTVPNLHSVAFKKLSITHPYYAFPPHLNYFSTQALARTLKDLGFEQIKTTTFTLPEEIHYCLELMMKLDLIKPDPDRMATLKQEGTMERIMVVARRPSEHSDPEDGSGRLAVGRRVRGL